MFSERLRKLKDSKGPRTLQALIDAFADKSFAVLFLLLMAAPALPLPTGGVTHVFEIIVMLLALELIAGRQTVWLPKKWLKLRLPAKFWATTLPGLIKVIEKTEALARPRLSGLVSSRGYGRLAGLAVLILALAAFLAPPFSGLDTLPSIGVLLISLALIFEDMLLATAGLVIGGVGIALIFLLGKLAFSLF